VEFFEPGGPGRPRGQVVVQVYISVSVLHVLTVPKPALQQFRLTGTLPSRSTMPRSRIRLSHYYNPVAEEDESLVQVGPFLQPMNEY
jgi:hypothetical protein